MGPQKLSCNLGENHEDDYAFEDMGRYLNNKHGISKFFSTTQVSYQYYLVLSPADGRLYVSDPERHQILTVVEINKPLTDPSINWEVGRISSNSITHL